MKAYHIQRGEVCAEFELTPTIIEMKVDACLNKVGSLYIYMRTFIQN
ncbi:hypothetical protein UT300003_26650 [Clostridium sardiniense]